MKTDKLCEAMEGAGITNPESQEGKDFCTKKCPYNKCIVYESRGPAKTNKRVSHARTLKSVGYSVEGIAKMLDISVRTVQRYLNQKGPRP